MPTLTTSKGDVSTGDTIYVTVQGRDQDHRIGNLSWRRRGGLKFHDQQLFAVSVVDMTDQQVASQQALGLLSVN